MLAQNFQTATDLGISEAQRNDLVRVLGQFEREEVPANLFTMRRVGEPECGTVGCILGWARGTSKNPVWHSDVPQALMGLFVPRNCERAWEANISEAATALRSYLTTGEANWAEALAV